VGVSTTSINSAIFIIQIQIGVGLFRELLSAAATTASEPPDSVHPQIEF